MHDMIVTHQRQPTDQAWRLTSEYRQWFEQPATKGANSLAGRIRPSPRIKTKFTSMGDGEREEGQMGNQEFMYQSADIITRKTP